MSRAELTPTEDAMTGNSPERVAARHVRFGWWSLLFFLTLGIALESLHGFKIGWYLDVTNETRRYMFTLGHAHGTMAIGVGLDHGKGLGPGQFAGQLVVVAQGL